MVYHSGFGGCFQLFPSLSPLVLSSSSIGWGLMIEKVVWISQKKTKIDRWVISFAVADLPIVQGEDGRWGRPANGLRQQGGASPMPPLQVVICYENVNGNGNSNANVNGRKEETQCHLCRWKLCTGNNFTQTENGSWSVTLYFDCLLSKEMNRLGMTKGASAKDNWHAENLNSSRSLGLITFLLQIFGLRHCECSVSPDVC